MKNFKCKLIEEGIHITGEAQNLMGDYYPVSLLISGNDVQKSWDEAMRWAQELGEGWALPTRAQGLAIAEHRDEINSVLKEAGKKPLGNWWWVSTGCPWDSRLAFYVYMSNGRVSNSNKHLISSVRAVSAFHPSLEV